jgi:hypothetical protein
MDLTEIGWGDRDWSDLGQVESSSEHDNEASGSRKC